MVLELLRRTGALLGPSEGAVFAESESAEVGVAERRPVAIVIDDEPSVRGVCCGVLTKAGWEAHAAASGAEGLALARRLDARIAVVDMTMPDMNGVETAAELRRLRPELPILYMSGYAGGFASGQLPPEGTNGFLYKPFTPAQLLQAMGEALELQGRPPREA